MGLIESWDLKNIHENSFQSVESWPGALQTTEKHIKGWKIGPEAEMRFPVSEAYGLPVKAKCLV